MHHHSLAQLAQQLINKTISSVELTHYFLARIQALDKHLNSFITVCEDGALAAAKRADKRRAKGENTPLLGLPLAHKDIFCTQGVTTTCGSKMLENFVSPYDATVVKKLRQAGMITLGKTNMDEFAMGSSNENSYYGPVKNPWDTTMVPGGSSGGSAAAVAARLVPFATATDTGGSIRQPAALCGITGLKPTYGRVSRYGMIAFASSLDQAGPMTLSAEDAAMILTAMAGFDPNDPTSIDQPTPNYQATLNQDLRGLKIGLPKEYFTTGLDKPIEQSIQEAIHVLIRLGATCQEISLPHTNLAIPTYYIVAPAECSSNLSRFDGVRFGHRTQHPKNIHDLYCQTRREGFGREVQRRIMIGTYSLSSGFYDDYYLKAQKARRLIANDFKNAFTEVDVILTPTAPTTAFKIGTKQHDPIQMYLSDIFTSATNLAGLPGLSLPIAPVNGMPVGMQLIGNYFAEGRLLNIAHRYQGETTWHTAIPALFIK